MTKLSEAGIAAIISNTSGDLLYVSQGGVDKKIDIDNFGIQGTFAATLTAATPPSATITTTANYRIIGNWVDLSIRFENVDTTGASGALSITGIPPAIEAADQQYGTLWGFNIVTSTFAPVATISVNTISAREHNNSSALNIIANTGRYLRINISYRI